MFRLVYKRTINNILRTQTTRVGMEVISDHLKTFEVNQSVLGNDGKFELKDGTTEPFYQGEKDGILYFYRKSYLHLLNGHMAVDGTYQEINIIDGFKQLYIVAAQVISDDGKSTICIPVVSAFFPNKHNETYIKFYTHLKEVTLQVTGLPLKPRLLTMDNEVASMLSAMEVLDSHTVTCLNIITQSFGIKLRDLGFPLDANPPYFVDQANMNLKHLVFFDMNDHTTYQLAMQYLVAQNAEAQVHLTPEQAQKFGQFLEYLHSTWFDQNSCHFIGKWSNYFPLISAGHFTITNNLNEALISSRFFEAVNMKSLISSLKAWFQEKVNKYKTFAHYIKKQKYDNMQHIL